LCELCVDEELLEDDNFDGVGEDLLVAAFAMAAPPPTSTPERTTAPRARFTGVTMCVHLLSWSLIQPSQEHGHVRRL
jgi:hypothetical protein